MMKVFCAPTATMRPAWLRKPESSMGRKIEFILGD
jgi:hypothetical protein